MACCGEQRGPGGPIVNFFEHQDAARRASRRLLWLLLPAMAALVLAANAAALVVWWLLRLHLLQDLLPVWPPAAFYAGVSLATAWVIAMGAWDSMILVAKGGAEVAQALGASEVDARSAGLAENRLRNVADELAIAAGMPAPRVYVMQDEHSINAFAAGLTIADAVVVVTRGALEELRRDELAGMVAHEFSHILNGDIRLNMRLFGLLGGILRLWNMGQTLLDNTERHRRDIEARGGRYKGAGLYGISGVLLKAVGWFGHFLARPISASVSRQRELLADACALQYTRDPDGLSGALQKMHRNRQGGHIGHPWAEQASHMFFCDARLPGGRDGVLTHPPVSERLSRIRSRQAAPAPAALKVGAPDTIGTVAPEQVAYAASLLDAVPPSLREALRAPSGAAAALYALLLAPEGETRAAQLALLGADAQRVAAMQPAVAALGPRARLPLVELAAPALRALSRDARREFLARLEALVAADRRVTLEEFVLQSLLGALLEEAGGRQDRAAPPTLPALAAQARVLLSLAAHAAGTEPRRAFAAGRAELGTAMELAPAADLKLPLVRDALARMRGLHALHKPRLLKALARAALDDGKLAVREVELLRAISAALDCPMPPLAVS